MTIHRPDLNSEPEKPKKNLDAGVSDLEKGRLSSLLALIPARVRALVFLTMIGLGGGLSVYSCVGEEQVDIEKDPILLSHQEGPWKFKVYRTSKEEVTDEHGKTLYHFIKGILEEKKLLPDNLSKSEELNFINAIIHFCRQMNPNNLDDFNNLLGNSIYFPEFILAQKSDGQEIGFEFDFKSTLEKDEELAKLIGGQEEGPKTGIDKLNGELDRVLENIASKHAESDNNVWPQVIQYKALMERVGAGSYHDIYESYYQATEGEMEPYKAYSAAQIQDKIDGLKAEKKDEKDGKEKIKLLECIRNTKMYLELMDILPNMKPHQVRNEGVLRGTVFDSRSKHPFYDLVSIWEWKKANKAKKKKNKTLYTETYDAMISALNAKGNTATMTVWLEHQQKACEYFRKHGTTLGYSPEIVHYMTPAVITSVIHAEFFSELSGRAYLDLLPTAFESGNLAYGPAVNDNEFSAGAVQVLIETFAGISNRQRQVLTQLQENDPSVDLIIPDAISKNQDGTYDIKQPKVVADAMLADLPSQTFYAILTVSDHIQLGINELRKDQQFKKAWDDAAEEERYLFIASFSAMAINAGRGGAQSTALNLLKKVDSDSLTAYITTLPNAASGKTRKRGAEKGLEAMKEILLRAHKLQGEKPAEILVSGWGNLQIPISEDYSLMRDRAIADGYPLSSDKEKNRKIYEATLANPATMELPSNHEFFFRKPNPDSIALMETDAYEVFLRFAKDFKKRTGYTLSYTDILRTPEYQDKMSPIDDSTHYTGRTIDIPDGRFKNPEGDEITWSVPTGKTDRKKNPISKKGTHADEIEQKLRPALVQLMEEYQAMGLMMVFPEINGGGHWHLYMPKREQ